ncbi:MAG: glycosyltransferase family 2 protein [Desulfobacula sp.]|jgi:glycosyltransferase involved in cell wall biosynthesis|nr:glycosyltransferase family 2 protein [Desulfobacula sp.]
MKVSIITVTFNCYKSIQDTITSVVNQDYPFIEHIIIDGASTDGTQDIIEQNRSKLRHFISEPDNGIYYAMNKGLNLASGSIVGILNGDDIFYDNGCISAVVEEFEKKKVEAVYGNLVYVASKNLNTIVRYYNSEGFTPKMFAYGHMPAHPAFFVNRDCYEKYGLFKEDYVIASDFELLLRFLGTYKISYSCLAKVLVKMRTGGVSTRDFKSNWILNKEIVRACRENNVNTNMIKVFSKYIFKVFQLVNRPHKRRSI